MKSFSSFHRPLALVVALLVALPAGCRKKEPSATAQQPAATPAPNPANAGSTTVPPQGGADDTTDNAPSWLANPSVGPGTTVMTQLDPKTLSPTEVQFGKAPKLSKDVDYQPEVIVMEEGDKAIKSVAGDGLTWTFDANAPHVSDFAEGKIVFATGRAVGRVTALKKSGSTVTVILGPVGLGDLIKKGRFVIDQPIDASKMISYVAPDWPGANDTAGVSTTSSLDGSGYERRSGVSVSLASNGSWKPTAMTLGGDRRVDKSREHLSRWARKQLRISELELAALRKKQVGFPQGVPQIPAQLPTIPMPPTIAAGPPPTVNLQNQDVEMNPIVNTQYVGIEYTYKKKGLEATAAGYVTLHAPVIRCVLTFDGGNQVDSAGISIKGAAGIRMRLTSHGAVDKIVNFKLTQFVPINISIPLGGPVPLSLTFADFFNINSAFSAKASLMVAEGMYNFKGGVWAGRTKSGGWTVSTPASFETVKSLGSSIAGLSLGINSFTLAFGIRTMVGVGAFGFNTGVFATVRFGGSILISPNETYACRQGTIDGFIDTGVGYQLPKPFTIVINFFLGAVGAKPIDAGGTLLVGPSQNLFSDDVSVPSGCAGHRSG